MDPQCKSQLLSLPVELRAMVLELVYPQNQSHNEAVDLLPPPTPPSKSLVLTNRKLYYETHDLYLTSYRSFWTSRPFVLNVDDNNDNNNNRAAARSALKTLRNPDMNHIRHLTITLTPSSSKFTLINIRGGWKAEVNDEITFRRFRPVVPQGTADPSVMFYDEYHEDEEALVYACWHYMRRGRPLMDQVLDLLELEV